MGGYDSDFSTATGSTSISSLAIAKGTLTVAKLAIE
jgi:hypothetical protein